MAFSSPDAAMAALQAAMARRDRAAINGIIAELLQARAPLGGQWRSLAALAGYNGELSLARAAMAAFVAAAGGAAGARFEQAAFLAGLGDAMGAEALAAALPQHVPSLAVHAHFRGVLALERGDRASARRWFDAALTTNPRSSPTWLSLAMSGNLADDPLGRRLAALDPAIVGGPPAERAQLDYALGKLWLDRGRHDAAFAAFARGAAALRTLRPYDPRADADAAARAMQGQSRELITRIGGAMIVRSDRPIFVTGLPRSGTTLVEQILVSHSEVAAGAELSRVQLLAGEVGDLSGDALARHGARPGAADALARLYLHLLDERFGPTGRIVDKTLDLGRHLGLVAAILPDAPLIWVTRDPLDRAWSCFHTFFASGVAWSHDLTDIAAHFRIEDRLLAFWAELLGDRLLVVPYEALVAEPADWTRRLLAHCGLAEEPAVFAPHKTERVVATSSVMQVRQPINRGAVGAAEPVRQHLAPFIRAYGAA